jgi:hypothetical protein
MSKEADLISIYENENVTMKRKISVIEGRFDSDNGEPVVTKEEPPKQSPYES